MTFDQNVIGSSFLPKLKKLPESIPEISCSHGRKTCIVKSPGPLTFDNQNLMSSTMSPK